jgi:NADH-quinone oxidoreductase subunit E
MASAKENGKVVAEAVKAAVNRYGVSRDELIPILNDVNRTLGYLPKEALEEICRTLRIPKGQLFSVASFYKMLSIKPRGRHVIRFCESAPCHVVGGGEVFQALKDRLGIEEGQTSADKRWTLETVSCLGVCAVGPVLLVDEDMYGNVTPEKLPEILARYP